jgi:AcrR family transcriptional regulator
MPRLAAERTTHLTPAEIAAEALRQFDAGPTEPSIRSLAAALRVAPAAIYHHFPSQAAIFQAAVEMVWNKAGAELQRLVPDPRGADPAEVLVVAGVATRRAWLAHHRLSPYMAATPEGNQFTTNALGLMARVFEGLGLTGEQAAASFHAYATFMIGAVLYAAANRTANEQLASDRRDRLGKQARLSLANVMEVSIADPARDEELFVQGLRRLVESLTAGGHRKRSTKRVTLKGRGPRRPR